VTVLCFVADGIDWLVPVGMAGAPIPVLRLRLVLLLVVHAIRLVLFGEETAVSLIFAVIPVMVVLLLAVIDAERNALLRWGSRDCQRYC
jgi:hypothetical protein